jgi:imidazolonepropionase-like amidohydrolase
MRTLSFHASLLAAGTLGFVALSGAAQAERISADAIFANGKVYTDVMTAKAVEAVAVRDGKILVTESTAEMKKLAGPATRITDLGGRAMLPGFYDNHIHLGSDGGSARSGLGGGEFEGGSAGEAR